MSAIDDFFAKKAPPKNVEETKSGVQKVDAIDQFFASRSQSAKPVNVQSAPQASPIDQFFASRQQKAVTAPPVIAQGPHLPIVAVKKPSVKIGEGTIQAPEPGFLDKPGFFSGAINTVKDAYKDVVQRGVDLTNAIAPSGKYNEQTQRYETPSVTPGQRTVAAIRAGVGAVNLAFAPISALFKGASDIQLTEKGKPPGPFEIPKAAVKFAAKAANKAFETVGELGSAGAGKVFEKLPQSEAIQQFKPVAQEVASLAAVLAVGKALHETSKLPGTIKEIKTKVAGMNDVVTSAAKILDVPTEKNVIGQIKKVDPKVIQKNYRELAHETHPDRGGTAQEFQVVSKAKTILEDYNTLSKGEFNAKYRTPLEEVHRVVKQIPETTAVEQPAIPKDKAALSTTEPTKPVTREAQLPTGPIGERNTGVPAPVEPGASLLTQDKATGTQIAQPTAQEPIVPSTPVEEPVKTDAQQFLTPTSSPTEVLTQEVAATKEPIANSKLNSAVYERLKAENPSLTEDVTYEKQNLKENADKAVELISKDSKQAYRIAMGVEEPPSGQTSTAVNIALAEKALAEGNTELYAQLVKNRSLEQTRRGQEIVAEKNSVTDNSTSRYVKDLIKLRMDQVDNKLTGFLKPGMLKKTKSARVTEVIDREVRKARERMKSTKEMDLDAAQSFLDSLAC